MTSDEQLASFAPALRRVVELMHTSSSFRIEALGMARRAANV